MPGSVRSTRVDPISRTVDIKKTGKTIEVHPYAIITHRNISPRVKEKALLAFARAVVEHGLEGDGPCSAGRDLLLKRPPRRREPHGPIRADGESLEDAAVRLVRELDGGVLAVQGPPGSGKTYIGGRMILALAGKHRIGVTAVSHKVIHNLLECVQKAAGEAGKQCRSAGSPAGTRSWRGFDHRCGE